MLKQIKNRKSGFTLIELLVVIILIALLAIALIAYINPIEQRRKAQDTAVAAVAAEYLAAQERYYASYGCYAHDGGDTGACPGTNTAIATGAVPDATLDSLVAAGEAKQSLDDRFQAEPYDAIVATVAVPADEMQVCFIPTSTEFTNKADCNEDGTGCNDANADDGAYCIPGTQD